MTQEQRRLYLIQELLKERPDGAGIEIPTEREGQKRLLRSLFNLRQPQPASQEFLAVQDAYLQEETRRKGVTSLAQLRPVEKGLYLWQGDITTLARGAIVNAANSQLLGCFYPCHGCIDNAIHTYAGVQLRLECAQLMARQGHPEPTGQAKVTQAYNLPCQYVLHTVGPIVHGTLTKEQEQQLASCYRSCLDLAGENHCKSVAFCCISTGEFHFPNQRAAEIAVETVKAWQAQHPGELEVVFNVFKDSDREIYEKLLG